MNTYPDLPLHISSTKQISNDNITYTSINNNTFIMTKQKGLITFNIVHKLLNNTQSNTLKKFYSDNRGELIKFNDFTEPTTVTYECYITSPPIFQVSINNTDLMDVTLSLVSNTNYDNWSNL